jgi:hypothetical protein
LRITPSNAPQRSASCIASALFNRLFDLISGFTVPGWLRTTPTSDTLTPRSNTSCGGSTFGLTMTTIDGVGVAAGS